MLEQLSADQQLVWVDWGNVTHSGPCTLTLRHNGNQIAQTLTENAQKLSVEFTFVGAAVGESIVVELCWGEGTRNLHVPVPVRPGAMPYGQLVSAPADKSLSDASRALCVAPVVESLPERGFGIELELMTEAHGLATDSMETGNQCITE